MTGGGSTDCSDQGTRPERIPGRCGQPRRNNVYVASYNDDAITEFARNADGSLTEIGCIADSSASGSTCSNRAATGLIDPEAIAISADGKNVYVAATDSDEWGDVAEFTRNADGTLTPIAGNACIAESGDNVCAITNGHGLESPVRAGGQPRRAERVRRR